MVFRHLIRLSLAALFVSAALPGISQVAPAATQRSWPLEIGGGFSYFSNHLTNAKYPTQYYPTVDANMFGATAWADWTFRRIPHILSGLGIEAEGRDLRHGNSGPAAMLHEDTGAGGVIYKWHHYRSFHPYGKFLVGYGSIDYLGDYYGCASDCNHNSDTFYDVGGGADVHIIGNLWARGDYEGEFWLNFGNAPVEKVTPKGFTIGVSYDMGNVHFIRRRAEY